MFTSPGTYHYICVIHGGSAANNPVTHMEGDVVVVAAAGGQAVPLATPGGLLPRTGQPSAALVALALLALSTGALLVVSARRLETLETVASD